MLAHSEVGEERVLAASARADQGVGRLHVAVHEAVGVRLVEGVGDLTDQFDRA
jgi:hypothetical protein